MKLNAKFSLTTGLFVALNVALSVFLIASFLRVSELRRFQSETGNTITDWFKLRVTLTDMFSVSFDIDTADELWEERKNSFKTRFDTVANFPLLDSLNPETVKILDNSRNLFDLIANTFESIDYEIEQLQQTPLSNTTKGLLKSNGISSVYNNTANLESSTIALFYLRLNNAIYKMNVYSDPFQNLLDDFHDALEAEAGANISSLTIRSYILLGISSLLMFFLITRMTGKITSRLQTISGETGNLARKDLTGVLTDHNKDEIGDLSRHLDHTLEALNLFMTSVKDTADEATGLSESINFSAGEVTAATTEISSNIESMERQFDNLTRAVGNAIGALESMTSFLGTFVSDINFQNSTVKESTRSISQMNESITLISRKGQEKVLQIESLKKVAVEGEEKISHTENLLSGVTTQLDDVYSFIEMINSIAEQTSILSMNAAIESAHAGEAGKGFAVVADEIQKLAESTAENAQQITATLTEIISNVQKARASSQVATSAFANTSGVITELSATLHEIVDEILTVDEKSSKISEQSETIEQSTGELSNKTVKLDILRKTVVDEIGQMEAIFAEARNGISEVNTGTGDILSRIMNINELSTQSKHKMVNLHAMLNEFTTSSKGIEELKEGTSALTDKRQPEISELDDLESAAFLEGLND